MLFRYYFFKEGTRLYDVADLISYFNANPYIDMVKKNESEKVAHYFNPTLDFACDFIIATKSSVPNIERLNPRYVEVNLKVEFNVLLPTYDVDVILNMCEDICKMFNFYVYNEVFEDVSPFGRSLMLKAFDIVKLAYKNKYPQDVANFYRLDKETLGKVYDYLQQSSIISDLLKVENVIVPKITFYAVDGKRKIYTAIEIDATEPFVFPLFVDMVRIVNSEHDMFISSEELYAQTHKLFHPIESSISNLYYTMPREIKKINKILNKANFSPLILELKKVDFSKVLDI